MTICFAQKPRTGLEPPRPHELIVFEGRLLRIYENSPNPMKTWIVIEKPEDYRHRMMEISHLFACAAPAGRITNKKYLELWKNRRPIELPNVQVKRRILNPSNTPSPKKAKSAPNPDGSPEQLVLDEEVHAPPDMPEFSLDLGDLFLYASSVQ